MLSLVGINKIFFVKDFYATVMRLYTNTWIFLNPRKKPTY